MICVVRCSVWQTQHQIAAPMADVFVGDHDAALGQDQLDVAQAEAEEVVQPYDVVDDLSRKAVATNCRPQLSSKHTPASVSDTLRVMRFSRRTPRRFSSWRVELLRVEAVTPSLDAAARS
jgi:hypothetical protein